MTPRAHILIVDDEPFNLDYLEQELDDLDYESVRATSGQEALDAVRRQPPDMVLLDLMMPHMDGFEVLQRIKSDPATRDIPVVMVSADGDLRRVVRGIQAGAEDYLTKPINPTLLQARIQNGLEKKRLRDQEQVYLRGLERELEIGREIQAGFLPKALPEEPGWEIAATFRAARQVAGDFYDAFALTEINRLGLLIGDVCDKGVGAALFMTLFRSLIRAGAEMDRWAEGGPGQPALVSEDDGARLIRSLSLTNNYIAAMHGDPGTFATVFFGMLDPATGDLVYVNAGHEEPLILSPTGVRCRLARTGIPLGLFPDSVYRAARIQLAPGETLLLLTDGVSDTQDESGAAFSRERLLALFSHGQSESAHSLLQRIVSSLDSHMGRAPQFDDITLIAIKRSP